MTVDALPLEITTYRVDGTYSDARHPDSVTFTPSLTEDLRRRDFTVNAMAYHPSLGLVDPFDGQGDSARRVIRCVGDAAQRFSEDALRLLRALRFAATLGFSLDGATAASLHRLSPTLSGVAAERLCAELNKLLCGSEAPRILAEFGDVLAGLFPCELDFARAAGRLRTAPPDLLLRYLLLLYDVTPEEEEAVAARLRFSHRFHEDLQSLLRCRAMPMSDKDSNLLALLNRLGPDKARLFLYARSMGEGADVSALEARLEQLLNAGACYSLAQLALDGSDLLAIGIPAGAPIGITLRALLTAVMQGDCPNRRAALLDYAKHHAPF